MDRKEVGLIVGICVLIVVVLVGGVVACWIGADRLVQLADNPVELERIPTPVTPAVSTTSTTPAVKHVRFASTVQVI